MKILHAIDIKVKQFNGYNKKKRIYHKFLKSPYWKLVRRLVLARDGKKCTKCKNSKRLQVHHLTYDHHRDELNHLGDLVTLCRKCHIKVHR